MNGWTVALRCQEAGCSGEGQECIFPDGSDGGIYCEKHAAAHGFCQLCGTFSAGIESFEFHHPGLCDNCDFQMKDATGELDDDDEPDEYWEPEW